jgi:hypothetical protein
MGMNSDRWTLDRDRANIKWMLDENRMNDKRKSNESWTDIK